MPEKALETKEEKEVKPEDVFGYGIDELRQMVDGNREIDHETRERYLGLFSEQEDSIVEFSDKNSARMKEILEKMNDWNPEAEMKNVAQYTKILDPDFCKSFLGYQFLRSIAEFEKINPSEKTRKILDGIISKNGRITFSELARLNAMDLSDKEVKLKVKVVNFRRCLLATETSAERKRPPLVSPQTILHFVRGQGLEGEICLLKRQVNPEVIN